MVVVESEAKQLAHIGAWLVRNVALLVLGLLDPVCLLDELHPKVVIDHELSDEKVEDNVEDTVGIQVELAHVCCNDL